MKNLYRNILLINFYFEERAAKKHELFIFFKGRYFVMGGSIDMNVGVF